ncbi:hypothetical protein B6A10_10110 [Flavobacterium sp. L1I52]|uniref:Type I restriction modification DNA specificity domain-containing protein n=1 Tax=Flavobacterium pokkalii TaxID=1940408 RepID=A0ABR7USA4_9FLAO|nr:restriction endonuclease subunit S [Flavobacterium pokkalii]MBD0725532.1 hypothetical protein [Flavobacterium pokkalii]
MSEAVNILDGWGKITLNEYGKVITGKTPSKNNPEDWGDLINFITPSEITNDLKYISNTPRKLSSSGKIRFKKMLLPANSVIVTCIGSDMGKVVINKNIALTNQQINAIQINEKENFDFVYYLLKNAYPILRKNAIGNGSTMPILNKSNFESLSFLVPNDTDEQKSIAAILTSFDDKIELLQAQNKTLEELAQTIFKEWFGKYQIGDELPERWRVGKLGDILDIKYGKDHKHLDDGNIPLYGSGGIMRYVEKPLYQKPSILIPRKGTLSNLFYLNEPFWSVDTMFYSEILKSFFGRFTFLFLKSLDLSAMNVGSAVPSLTTQVLNQIPIVIPIDEVVMNFDDIVKPFYQKLESNNIQIQTLTQTRDTLLPYLMSGEIRVKM